MLNAFGHKSTPPEFKATAIPLNYRANIYSTCILHSTVFFCFQIEASEEKLKKQEVELEFLHQQLTAAKKQLKEARLQADEQKETVTIVKQKYTAAIEKVHKVQGRVGLLEEELRYSQQQVDNV